MTFSVLDRPDVVTFSMGLVTFSHYQVTIFTQNGVLFTHSYLYYLGLGTPINFEHFWTFYKGNSVEEVLSSGEV